MCKHGENRHKYTDAVWTECWGRAQEVSVLPSTGWNPSLWEVESNLSGSECEESLWRSWKVVLWERNEAGASWSQAITVWTVVTNPNVSTSYLKPFMAFACSSIECWHLTQDPQAPLIWPQGWCSWAHLVFFASGVCGPSSVLSSALHPEESSPACWRSQPHIAALAEQCSFPMALWPPWCSTATNRDICGSVPGADVLLPSKQWHQLAEQGLAHRSSSSYVHRIMIDFDLKKRKHSRRGNGLPEEWGSSQLEGIQALVGWQMVEWL